MGRIKDRSGGGAGPLDMAMGSWVEGCCWCSVSSIIRASACDFFFYIPTHRPWYLIRFRLISDQTSSVPSVFVKFMASPNHPNKSKNESPGKDSTDFGIAKDKEEKPLDETRCAYFCHEKNLFMNSHAQSADDIQHLATSALPVSGHLPQLWYNIP